MDWLFKTEEGICHVRVAAICVLDGKLLAQKSGEDYALPGGHLRFGETTQEALAREFREELGIEIQCSRLLWTEENFWRWGDKDAHNLSYYYQVHLPGDCPLPQDGAIMLDNSSVSFHWLPIDELENKEIYPEYLGRVHISVRTRLLGIFSPSSALKNLEVREYVCNFLP